MAYQPLVDFFSSEPFVAGDEGEQRLLIKPLQVAAQAQQPVVGAANPYSAISRQETILAMHRRLVKLLAAGRAVPLTLRALPFALCPLPSALCPLPSALCPLPSRLRTAVLCAPE